MKIAYLVNQYPKISHVFIRREILAVEGEGFEVFRFAIRRSADVVIDSVDVEEAGRTHTLLDAGWPSLLQSALWAAAVHPLRFLESLLLAVSVGLRSDRGLARHLVYLAEACLLLRLVFREGIRHIHAHFGTNSAMVAMLCRALGGPSYSFTVHGPEEFDNAGTLGLRQKIRRAAFVVAITSYARSQLFRLCEFRAWPKIKVVRCGVDAQFLGAAPAPMPERRRLLSIGRLCEQKGQMLLIDALAMLQREGRDIDLVLIGDGELRDDLERAITRHALVEKVRIVGWASSDAIRTALDDSCALVLPSFAEGLPVVIMEAFARARPVLSTFVAGIPELVFPGRNGWLVPAGSVEAIAAGMREILDTPRERLEAMGLCGREDARRLHDIQQVARDMATHLRTAMTSQPGGSQEPRQAEER
jgi:colanic acid/amylovoran biosynthesis glycosyltransferase